MVSMTIGIKNGEIFLDCNHRYSSAICMIASNLQLTHYSLGDDKLHIWLLDIKIFLLVT